MTVQPFDSRNCELGEGPLWHPKRHQLFWFDILGRRLLTRDGDSPREWKFDEYVSAAGWIDHSRLLIASETRLFRFDLESGTEETICRLEANDARTRSNDGRADPHGGFWIGTMGKRAEKGVGSIYRYFSGELRRIHSGITVPNSICFAADGTIAYFADTRDRRIQAQALGTDGWPKGEPHAVIDLRADGLNPDGSVTDSEGNIWNAQWGASRVAGYRPDGSFIEAFPFPALHTSCPAFGGPDLSTLYCTTAQEHLSPETIAGHPENGMTFAVETSFTGWREPQVIL